MKLYHQELVPQSFKCSKCGKGKNAVEFYVKPNATRPNQKAWVSKVCKKCNLKKEDQRAEVSASFKKYWESKK